MFLVLSISRFDCTITTDSKTREWRQFTENSPYTFYDKQGGVFEIGSAWNSRNILCLHLTEINARLFIYSQTLYMLNVCMHF